MCPSGRCCSNICDRGWRMQWHEYNVELTPLHLNGHTRSHPFPTTNGATVKPFIYSEVDLHCHRCGTPLCRYHSLFQNESPDVLKKPEAIAVCCFFFGGESHWLRGKDWTFWVRWWKNMEQRRDGIGEQWLRYFGHFWANNVYWCLIVYDFVTASASIC